MTSEITLTMLSKKAIGRGMFFAGPALLGLRRRRKLPRWFREMTS